MLSPAQEIVEGLLCRTSIERGVPVFRAFCVAKVYLFHQLRYSGLTISILISDQFYSFAPRRRRQCARGRERACLAATDRARAAGWKRYRFPIFCPQVIDYW